MMENIQMTQIGIDNYMLYTKDNETKLCKICQIYPDDNFVDIVCIDKAQKYVEKIDYSINLKPILVCDDIIKKLGFSINFRKNYPQTYGHPDNLVFDLAYKDKLNRMVVLIDNLYYFLFHDTTTFCKTEFPLCVHHLQNLKMSIGDDSIGDDISLINLLKHIVLI